MKVIITGGTGLIGRALAESLTGDGHEVILLSRHGGQNHPGRVGIRVAQWDGRSAAGWGELANGADAIINLAGANLAGGLWTDKRKREIIESRANAGAAVVDAVRQARVKPGMVLQISGVGAYGISESAEYNEDAPYGSDFLAGVTKVWERATQPVEALGVRRVVARTGVVLSPEAGALPMMLLPFRLFVGGRLGSGRQWLSWVHLTDQVRALRFLVETPQASGIYNIAAQAVTNREFARIAAKVMRRPNWFPVPGFALRLVLGELSTTVLDGQRVSSRKLQELGFAYQFQDLEAALIDNLARK